MVVSRGFWPTSDFAAERKRFKDRYRRFRPALVVISAPSGYGKSVLAGQLGEVGFAHRLWIDLAGQAADSTGLLEAVAPVLLDHEALGCSELGLVPGLDYSEILSAVASSLSELSDGPVLLVLDGLHQLADLRLVGELSSMLVRLCGRASGVVVTTREVLDYTTSGAIEMWTLSASDLLLDSEEAKRLVSWSVGDTPSDDTLAALVDASGGHAATLSIMTRHVSLTGSQSVGVGLTQDLRAYLLNVARASLSNRQLDVLAAVAMLASGTTDDLEIVAGANCGKDLLILSETIPLVRVFSDEDGGVHFQIHELAAEPFSSPEFVTALEQGASVAAMALKHLRVNANHDRLLSMAKRWSTPEEYAALVEDVAHDLLLLGRTRLLRQALSGIPVSIVASRPRLLLVRGRLERLAGDSAAARRSASAAYEVCRYGDDAELTVESRLLLARTMLDTGDYEGICTTLNHMAADGECMREPRLACLCNSYLSIALAQSGDIDGARMHSAVMIENSRHDSISSEVRAHATLCYLWLLGPHQGDWAETLPSLEAIRADARVSVGTRVQSTSNLAWSLVQTGRLSRALGLLVAADEMATDAGISWIAHNIAGTRSVALLGLGKNAEAEQEHARAVQGCLDTSDAMSTVWSKLTAAVLLRVRGKHDESMNAAEEALAIATSDSAAISGTWAAWARTEVAASFLAIGDECAAEGILGTAPLEAAARHNTLRASLIGAEIRRRRAEESFEARVEMLRIHKDYILSESANWELAMYIRTFPGLLGVVAAAVGVDKLPTHMLRMIMPEHARAALPLARDVLDADDWKTLAARLLGDDGAGTLELALVGEPKVRVRLFGGLEVTTPDGVVPDRAWKKRKARLLFMMLVTKQGRDVPRDILLECLWPDMTEESARNNFYVIWSTMKRALAPAGRGAPCPYVEHVGGICRIVRPLVRSDLDDFDQTMAEFEEAEAGSNLDVALAKVRRLREIYRADLLPSEIYDDWFRPIRDRYRVHFGNAMLRISRMCRDAGDLEHAVEYVRAGLEYDPWREDLYQAAIRYQIDIGQRSGAVDMFMACRAKLSEDLGLDPSVETRKLYEEVLAMEDSPER